jgi:outer membrane beta-barrel protein
MTKRRTAIGSFLLALTLALPALAQEGGDEGAAPEEGATEEGKPEGEEGPPPSDATPPPSDEALKTTPDVVPQAPAATVAAKPDSQESWKDIVVLPRKPFLKSGRVELMPFFAVTMNDNLIQHFALGGEINYFLTDILSLGISGRYYFKSVLDNEFWTRYHFGRVPSLNRYIYTTTLNFSYVPFYGKFAVFNKSIMHYEIYASAGVGISGTEIIPRDYQNETFTNPVVISFRMPGLGARLFITKWLAAHILFEGLGMIDKYEPSPRALGTSGDDAKSQASSAFVYNMMFNVGVSFFLPTGFNYTTFR